MEPKQAKTLLWTFFAGQATPFQKHLLSEWLREGQNDEAYYKALHEWEKLHPQVLPDTGADWQELLPRLNQPLSGAAEVKAARRPWRNIRWQWLAAASVVFLLAIGWWQQKTLLYRTYSTDFGETRRVELPDGSRVTLNANSSLRFPRFLPLAARREAVLRGEAEFSVVHTIDNRPFLVHTPDSLEIRVLGTEFVVYSRGQESRVILNRGKVTMRSLKSPAPALTIRPGDVVTVDLQGQMAVREKQPVADYAAWKEHRFVFDRTPLRDIARQIRERFGVTVQIPDSSLAAQRVSGNYPAQTADDVIKMLTQLLNIEAAEQSGSVVLRPAR